jgi:alkanesulfonate monooxygenase SsuD/methylene tetrahydromethanopterin reductase-like flavin-dependent oxidoreductase (luciferase family)
MRATGSAKRDFGVFLPVANGGRIVSKAALACSTQMAIGSPAACAEQLDAFLTERALDGVMLIFPDYVEGLDMFSREIPPFLAGAPA